MWNSDEFQKELESLLNKHSIDNLCETPDFILAEHVTNYLVSLGAMVGQREAWFGRSPEVVE
jgi:hypothetical protein